MSTIERLRERVETLEEENRQLRTVLQLPIDAKVPTTLFGVPFTRQQIVLMVELARAGGRVVPHERLKAVCKTSRWTKARADADLTNTHAVQLCRIRKALQAVGAPIDIATAWGIGYYLEGDVETTQEALGVKA